MSTTVTFEFDGVIYDLTASALDATWIVKRDGHLLTVREFDRPGFRDAAEACFHKLRRELCKEDFRRILVVPPRGFFT